MLSPNGELKADEYWMSAEISWVHDVVRGQRLWRATNVKALKVKVASLNRMLHSIGNLNVLINFVD